MRNLDLYYQFLFYEIRLFLAVRRITIEVTITVLYKSFWCFVGAAKKLFLLLCWSVEDGVLKCRTGKHSRLRVYLSVVALALKITSKCSLCRFVFSEFGVFASFSVFIQLSAKSK